MSPLNSVRLTIYTKFFTGSKFLDFPFYGTNEMMEKLYSSRADGSYRYTIQKYLKPDLLILDEIGL
ncbi:ATP-binding protein [Pedobacter sp. AW31-3R]|uniref:ATP-binding protein n=1 Tax=Pedobacter sp. AW31-3R TaxID=3445781 RepID=UPI003F9F16FC